MITSVPADVELPEETVDVEPEADYETYLEVVGGEPLVESAPVAAGGPVTVTITGPDGAATSSAATVVVGTEAAGGGSSSLERITVVGRTAVVIGAQALPHPRR